VYAADGTYFRGMPVVQCALSGTQRALQVQGLAAPLFASGSRPWIYNVFRFRATPTTDGFNAVSDFGVAGAADFMYTRWRRFNSGANQQIGLQQSGGSDLALKDPGDLLPHRVKVWLDGTNANGELDGTLFQTPNAGSLSSAVTAIGAGCAASAAVHVADVSLAKILACSAQPSAAQIAAVDNLVKSIWF
jgi:hypothetical protein